MQFAPLILAQKNHAKVGQVMLGVRHLIEEISKSENKFYREN